jgi:hypothetical protein
VKQTHKGLRPKRSFIRHDATLEQADLEKDKSMKQNIPIHGPQTISYGWEWYEMGFLVHWTPLSTTVLCIDLPQHLQASIQTALMSSIDRTRFSNPYSIFVVLFSEVLSLYDNSVWSIRNHICDWEAVAFQTPSSLSYRSLTDCREGAKTRAELSSPTRNCKACDPRQGSRHCRIRVCQRPATTIRQLHD